MARNNPGDKPPPAAAKKDAPAPDPKFQAVLTLLGLLRNARHKAKKSEFQFLAVNQTFNLVRYRNAVFWEYDGNNVTVASASGLVQVDAAGPYAQWLARAVRPLVAVPAPRKEDEEQSFVQARPMTAADCAPEIAAEWKQWVAANALLVTFFDNENRAIGGLWIDRDEPFTPLDVAFLEDAGDGFSHILQGFRRADGVRGRTRRALKSVLSLSGWKGKALLGVLFLCLFFPVRTSVTAPAEIAPRAPYVVSVPFDGTIETVEIVPGQAVKKGDLLAGMNSTILKSRYEVASQELDTALVALGKTEREAFTDRTKLAEIAILKSQVAQKEAEKKFAGEMLARAEIRAERDGIALFADPNVLRGKPVVTGEQVMLLADPDDSELLIRVPVDAMIRINESVPAKFFLNVTPLGSRSARYTSVGYQATPDPDGLLTYKVRAQFDVGGDKPRVGWTGTGKIYGERTVLVFNILRRPMVTLRRKLGI